MTTIYMCTHYASAFFQKNSQVYQPAAHDSRHCQGSTAAEADKGAAGKCPTRKAATWDFSTYWMGPLGDCGQDNLSILLFHLIWDIWVYAPLALENLGCILPAGYFGRATHSITVRKVGLCMGLCQRNETL